MAPADICAKVALDAAAGHLRCADLVGNALWIPFAAREPHEGWWLQHTGTNSRLFALPQVLLAGWVHYLAFDLFTGSWEARDAVRLGISRWLVAPCLVLTFLFGPVGLALYLLLRLVLRREVGA